MIWKKEVECMPVGELRELQLVRLKALIARVADRVPFYKAALREAGVTADDIASLDDMQKLPFTRKTELRDSYPFGMFAVPLDQVIELHASSGTTGNPTVVAYTKNDIALWSDVMARALVCAGAMPGDIIQNAYGYGLFTGGLGVHYGALELGATVVPMSAGGTKRQIKLMHDFGATVLTCTPSYALFMAEEAADMGIEMRRSPIRIGIHGAEPWSDGIRREIEDVWNMKAMDIYGLSEVIGPGVAMECEAQNGLHLFADVFLPEIVNPETDEPVPDGQSGELVITTLTKEALPLIRYRTGDIVSITHEPCEVCGRTSPRISKIRGRTDDMLIIRGVNVFPSQIESVLLEVEGAKPHYQLIVDRTGSLDQLEVQVEVDEGIFSDEIKVLEELERRIHREIESVLGLSVAVKLVEPRSIERSMGKAKRVIDKRQL